ncbi:MAG TPA: acyltransferase family protein [Mycobacteriales bacterium]|jgi:peptidoglycan/LPS O-acetylase OafA/YrhL|nr:acyltransferase family protein [Mycobacteriales bacterium]
MADDVRSGSWRYRPELDGLRSIAVYLVVLFHSGLAAARGGFIGVDLFFVLSGFLITNVLLNDIDEGGRVRFGSFYSRRARRLLLPAVVVVGTTCVVFLLISNIVERLPLVRDAQSALLYVANWRFLSESNNYFATGFSKSPFLHFWSLGIEEQFYIVFPLLLLAAVRAGRRYRWVPAAAFGTLFVLSLTAQVYWAQRDPNHAYYGTDTRAYQLLAGVLLAMALRAPRARLTRRGEVTAEVAAVAGMVGVLLLGSGLADISVSRSGIAAAVASVLLIGGLTAAEHGRLGAALSRPVPVYLGRISYATYLWHWPIIIATTALYAVSPLEVAGIAIVTATALAALSSMILEQPVRRSQTLDRFRWPTVAAGVSLCTVAAFALVPPVLDSTRRPTVTTAVSQPEHHLPALVVPVRHRKSFQAQAKARIPNLNWQSFVNNNGPARTCTAAAPQQCVVVKGAAPSVLLVGDSHARMLAPVLIALAKEHGFTLSINAMSSCPWQADLTNLAMTPQAQAQCTASRAAWYREVLPKLHPDLVLLASYARDDVSIYGHSLLRTSGSNESLHQLINDTTNETLASITRTGARALILDSIIISSFDPLQCLASSTYLRQCEVSVPHTPPISDSYYNAAASRSNKIFTFNINRVACPTAPACLPMIDGIPVWRNVNHYTTQILTHLRQQVWNVIVRSGALKGLP